MRKNRRSFVAQTIGAVVLMVLSLPIAAKAYTNCYHGGGCTTCFFYSDDGLSTYQGYMHYCPREV